MDSVFSLKPEDCSNFLRGVGQALGCVYICLWSYIPHPASCLVSMEGWLYEEDTKQQGNSSTSPIQRLFEQYRRSFCSVETGCVPGLAYKEGVDYLEIDESKLMRLAATHSQRQFYEEAGIKTAVFMGCRSGEIELGMTTANNINMEMDIRNMFSEEFVQKPPLGEFFLPVDQVRPSSSSSSLRSLSLGSPECSSLVLSKASTPYMPADTTLMEASTEKAIQAPAASVPPHQETMQAYGRTRNTQFPTPADDDAAMARAMIAVILSPSSSSSAPLWPQSLAQQITRESRRGSAFKPYNSAFIPRVEPRGGYHSQKMIKRAVSILRQIHAMKSYARIQETRPSSNQLHHMISERRRREKLNESFAALRMLLPPGTKKDKASVLVRAKEYINSLKAQISEVEEKNRLTEARLSSVDERGEEADRAPGESVRTQIVRAPSSPSSSSSSSSNHLQRVELRVTVWVECDVADLVLPILECLKEMRNISLLSLEANGHSRQANAIRRAVLTIQIEGGGWDERAFTEAINRAVAEAVAPPAP